MITKVYLACTTAKRGEHGILREARNECEAQDLGRRKTNSRKQNCGNQSFKLDEARSAVAKLKVCNPEKGVFFWNLDGLKYGFSTVFHYFPVKGILKICWWDKRLALSLASRSPAKCFVHADKCCCTVRCPSGCYYFLSLYHSKGQSENFQE